MKRAKRALRTSIELGCLFVLLLSAFPALAQQRKVREYKLHEPEDRGAPFSLMLGPDHTAYILQPRRDGNWILSEVRGWWQDHPSERGIAVEGFSARDAVNTIHQMDIALTPDGRDLLTILSATLRVAPDDPNPMEMLVELIPLDSFQVTATQHMRSLGMRGNLRAVLDPAGQLLVSSAVPPAEPTAGDAPYVTWFQVALPDMKAHLMCSFQASAQGAADPKDEQAACGASLSQTGYAALPDIDKALQLAQPPEPPTPPAVEVTAKDRVHTAAAAIDGKAFTLVVVNGVILQIFSAQ
ncbi:MAG TPA: hypothetical protein VHX60_01225 [Acidobacteriaceae bacterium]|jgi:hypothetical protein|nr:hypothetical protein [Acidobacteriaceae bacterium]